MGKPLKVASAREYYEMKSGLWDVVATSLDRLRAEYDVVVIEGAGSPAEINLKEHDIVNMRVARHAHAPVLLVGDIDRGGVFAHLVGTLSLLEPEDQALVKGFVINKFRGDPSLLDSGLDWLLEHTGIPVAGVLPYYTDIQIPEEDSLGLDPNSSADGASVLDLAVIRLPRIANFDDFDPLSREPGVHVRYVKDTSELGDPDLIVIPGTKTTIADLGWLRRQGLDRAIVARRESGTPIVGICGGYQMLGRWILDPGRVESQHTEVDGLGLLPVTTEFHGEKTTHQVTGEVMSGPGLLEGSGGSEIEGYEIHMGETVGQATRGPIRILRRSGGTVDEWDGCLDSEGLTFGTYIHGLFHNPVLRRGLLTYLAARKAVSLPAPLPAADSGAEFDKLADLVREYLDMELVDRIVGVGA